MKSLELFSGAGGLAKGLELSGFEHLALVEFNADACATLRKNFKQDRVYHGDIQTFDFSSISNVDLVTGGPPCQPFSLGGKHGASEDNRDMFPYAIKAIQELRPKAFVFENVKGLLRPSFARYFEYIIKRLQFPDCQEQNYSDWEHHFKELQSLSSAKQSKPDYHVDFKLINMADYGVPQTRERVIIVGIRSDLNVNWNFPEGDHNLDKLIWDQYVSGEYWERHGISQTVQYDFTPSFSKKIQVIQNQHSMFSPAGKAWATMRDALGTLPDPDTEHQITDHIFKDGARSYPGHTGSIFDLPSKTIKAGAHGVPGGENMIRFADNSIRYLTVHEAKLIQCFPPDFIIEGAWGEAMRQIGNAVPVNFAQIIAEKISVVLTNCKINQAA